MNSVYHKGERKLQELMGVRNKSDSLSSMIKNEMPVVASQFLETLNFCVITFEANKKLYTSVISDTDYFIKALSSNEIQINLDKSTYIPSSIFEIEDLNIGFIGLEFENRMRIRINGKGKIKDNKLFIKINEVYSNCPKYINDRKIIGQLDFLSTAEVNNYDTFINTCSKIIHNTDTFFLASSHKNKGADISHKGGKKGFLKVVSPTQIEFDDYAGNNMYNSLGNICLNPNISILVIDFFNNDILHINGKATIVEYEEQEKKKLKVRVDCTKISIESNSFLLKYDK